MIVVTLRHPQTCEHGHAPEVIDGEGGRIEIVVMEAEGQRPGAPQHTESSSSPGGAIL